MSGFDISKPSGERVMKQKKQDSKREIENLKRLREIEAMIQKGDIENVFVSNASKDSETVSNAVADDILNKLGSEKIDTRDISNMISFTSNKTTTVIKRPNRNMKAKAKARKPAPKTFANRQKKAQVKPKAKPKKAKTSKKPQHKIVQKKKGRR